MAKSKKKTATKKAAAMKPVVAKKKPSAPKAAPAAAQKASTASAPERVELDMLAARPAIDDATRDAFRSQCGDARAEALGEATKGKLVLLESRAQCVRIAAILASLKTGQKVRYTDVRLTWLLECVSELADQVDADAGGGGTRSGAVASVTVATARARTQRNDLLLAIEEIADGNDALEAEVGTARGGADSPSDILRSLRSLVDLAMRWVATYDPALRALVAASALTATDIDAARTAASDLATSLGGKSTATAALGHDSVATNRVEGRVLFELGKAMTALNAAAERGIGQKLTAGPATRRVLGRVEKKTPAAKAPATPAA